jgi:uncharacterized protein YgbK (DUF1537 family)
VSTVLGCIADDFTGATDLAGILARSGYGVSLRIGVPAQDDPAPSPFEVVALKCRTTPVDDAVHETAAALAWLERTGARHFFWKYCSTFDSTAEGNIGPVAEALMNTLGTAQTVYCPAFPENGRSIYKGHLFVGDEPLDESPMKDHPLTPMRDSSLERLLAPQVRGRVGAVYWSEVRQGAAAIKVRLDALAAEGIAHVVLDCIEDGDLRQIAQACWDMPLITGGSALALGLPECYRANGEIASATAQAHTPDVDDTCVVLSGSCSAMTRAQVAEFSRRAPALRLDPLALAGDFDAALAEAGAWLDDQPLAAPKLVFATAEPDAVRKAQEQLGRQRAGEVVEQAMARLAVRAFERGVRRFVVAGGETSGAVTQALGVSRLDIGSEIAPGVPWTFARHEGADIALALKSGNFGEETFFDDALTQLP